MSPRARGAGLRPGSRLESPKTAGVALAACRATSGSGPLAGLSRASSRREASRTVPWPGLDSSRRSTRTSVLVDGRVAARVGRRVQEPAQRGQRIGPEPRAGILGGHSLELLLAQIDGIVAPIADRAFLHRLEIGLEPLAAAGGVAQLNWRRASISKSEPSGSGCAAVSSPLVHESSTPMAALATVGLGASSAGIAAWQASSDVVRDVSFFIRAAIAPSASIAAAGSPAARASWAERIEAGSCAITWPCRAAIACLSSSALPARTAQAASSLPALRGLRRAFKSSGVAYRNNSVGRAGGMTTSRRAS